jgi:aminoglycoside 3'-phosphotransferase II
LGAALMTALPGAHPHEAALPAAEIIASLARGLRALHALPAAHCPFDESIAARLERARAAIEAGHVDPGEFDARNLGRSPLEIYRQLAAQAPRIEPDIVLVHGDATFDNLLLDAGGNLGFIDCGHAGRGDRYVDLQTIASDIEDHFGPQWIEPFAHDYGIGLDQTKLRFFDDLYELF